MYLAQAGIPFTDVMINFKDKPKWLLDAHPPGKSSLGFCDRWVVPAQKSTTFYCVKKTEVSRDARHDVRVWPTPNARRCEVPTDTR